MAQNQNQHQNKKGGGGDGKKQSTPKSNVALQAISAIREGDDFNQRMPKVEAWLESLSDFERGIVFANLGRLSVEEAKSLISQIIGKEEADRRAQTKLLGLFQQEGDEENFQSTLLQLESEGLGPEVQALENWLIGLTPDQAAFFRMSLSKLKPENSRKVLAWLVSLADDNTRTQRAQARGLVPRN